MYIPAQFGKLAASLWRSVPNHIRKCYSCTYCNFLNIGNHWKSSSPSTRDWAMVGYTLKRTNRRKHFITKHL